MRVLQVIDILNAGGAEKMFLNITSLLVESGVDVSVMLFSNKGELTSEINGEVIVYDLARKNKYSVSRLFKAHQICSLFDIVHVHMRHVYAYIRIAQRVFNGKYKVILHDHFGDIGINKNVPFRLRGVLAPEYYIGVSNELKEWATANLKIKSENCFVLKNIIVPDARIEYKFQPTGRSFMVTNIRSTKNIEFAIRLFKKAKFPLAVFGSVVDADYYDLLRDEIGGQCEMGIITGVTNFAKHYNEYDLAVHCSRSETGPLVLLEYLAYGIPFLSYSTGEVAETVKAELPLHFIDSFDENEWLGRMATIRSQGDISDKLKDVYRKHFDSSMYVEQCRRIYESVICS